MHWALPQRPYFKRFNAIVSFYFFSINELFRATFLIIVVHLPHV